MWNFIELCIIMFWRYGQIGVPPQTLYSLGGEKMSLYNFNIVTNGINIHIFDTCNSTVTHCFRSCHSKKIAPI